MTSRPLASLYCSYLSVGAFRAAVAAKAQAVSAPASAGVRPIRWRIDQTIAGKWMNGRMHASEPDSQREAERQWLRGVSEDGRPMGPSAPLPDVRSRWLLRFLEEQARHETLSHHTSPHRPVL